MPRKIVLALPISLLTILLCASNASAAAVLYSTLGPLGQYDQYSVGAWVQGLNYGNQAVADAFTPNATMNIADVVLSLGYYAGNNTPVDVYLESDNGGVPGSILDTLAQVGTIPPWTFGPAGGGGGLVTFNCRACPVVNTGTRYWIVGVETDQNSEQNWLLGYTDPMGLIAYNYLGSPVGPWSALNPWYVSGLRVDGLGSSTPEPGTFLMLGTGFLAAAGCVRRKLRV